MVPGTGVPDLAALAPFPAIVSFVTSRAAFQPVNVCSGRSKFPAFSFTEGNFKFRMQPLFFSFFSFLSRQGYCRFLFFLFLFMRTYSAIRVVKWYNAVETTTGVNIVQTGSNWDYFWTRSPLRNAFTSTRLIIAYRCIDQPVSKIRLQSGVVPRPQSINYKCGL